MSDENQPQSTTSRVRRSSFAGQTFAELFGNARSSGAKPKDGDATSTSPPTGQFPGPISQAAAEAQRRRISLSTLGTSPFGSFRGRRDSIGSANSGSVDESAIAEDDNAPAPRGANNGSPPSTPFARRMSFGARAMRDMRAPSFNGGAPGSPNGARPSPASASNTSTQQTSAGTISARDNFKGRGSNEGFNWSDNFRSRAERTSSVAAQGGGTGTSPPMLGAHTRAKSVAVMEPPPQAAPKPKEQVRPDHFQERILKGDFYMD